MKKNNARKRGKLDRRESGIQRGGEGGRKAKLFLLLAFGVGSYFFGSWISPTVGEVFGKNKTLGEDVSVMEDDGGTVHTAEFSEEDSVAVAGSTPEYTNEDKAKPKAVKSSTGSVFSEGDPPLIIGEVPEGWRVETSNEIKAKFGPHKVPIGDDITFVVPVYTLVPSDTIDGVYIIEPGRTQTGDDEGGTLSAILARLDGEISAISTALGSLSKALAMLPAEESESQGLVEKGAEGISYRASVSGR